MRFGIHLKLFAAMVSVGAVYGFVYHLIVMPLFSDRLLHCLLTSAVFGIINYIVTINVYKRYFVLKEKNKLLSKGARTDQLTGVLNRKALDEDIENIDDNRNYSMLFMDIDNFRDFNNKFGHPVGDLVLKKVSRTIKSSIRFGDKVYRYGGEEFLIILKDCSKSNAREIAEKIRINVSELNNSPYPNITLSIGVSSYPEDGDAACKLIEVCDNAMLNAKKHGKNRTFTYLAS